MEVNVDTGDVVFHKPSKETWVVARADLDYIYPCGWPSSRADIKDCEFREKAKPEYRVSLLMQIAMGRDAADPRTSYARYICEKEGLDWKAEQERRDKVRLEAKAVAADTTEERDRVLVNLLIKSPPDSWLKSITEFRICTEYLIREKVAGKALDWLSSINTPDDSNPIWISLRIKQRRDLYKRMTGKYLND